MIVRINEACPGQSTKVICKSVCPSAARCSGTSVINDENPEIIDNIKVVTKKIGEILEVFFFCVFFLKKKIVRV